MSHHVTFRLAALAIAVFTAGATQAATFAPTATAGSAAASATVAAAPVAAETFTVGLLKVERFGSTGRPVVLVPGLAGGTWVWRDTIAALAGDHRVYAVTLAGFDGTPPPSDDGVWLDRVDASLADLLRRPGMDKAIVVGHSVGGTVALRFAGRHPQLSAGIVAVDGLPIFPGMEHATAEQRSAMAKGMRAQIEAASPEAFQAQQLAYMQTIGTRDPATATRVAPLNARSNQKAVARYMAEDLSADFRPVLKDARVPILELVPYDPAYAATGPTPMTEANKTAYYASLLADAPQAKVVAIAPSRHYVMLDQPAAFQKALADFIRAH
ncbi:alpha/beta fold hydrolase [Xanthomonas sp. NCPPB 2632]|uniref:alpha/beta fold hydrolase n=1 Tax=Xanthomonas sp. NCPPB 2632 TaxID=3240912 RepID=UPI003516AA1E